MLWGACKGKPPSACIAHILGGPATSRGCIAGQRILCESRRLRCGGHPAVHLESGGAREARQATGVGRFFASEVGKVGPCGGSRQSRAP